MSVFRADAAVFAVALLLTAPVFAAAIESHDLAPPALDSVGTLVPGQGGLPADLWSGTSAEVARALLPRLPVTTGSPVVRGLIRRLVLSAGAPPKGAADSDRPLLAELRAQTVLAVGDAAGMLALSDSIPAPARGPRLTRLRLDAALLAGRRDIACAELNAAQEDAELAKIRVLCRFAAGDGPGAALGLDLLRDRAPPDTAFITAAEAMAGLPPPKKGGLTALPSPSPVQLAAVAGAKMAIPADAVDGAEPMALPALAASEANSSDFRLAAAERAEALGVMNTDGVRKVMAQLPFTPELLATPLAGSEGMPGPRALALFVRSLDEAVDPVLVVPVVTRALEQAAARGRFATAARLLAPHILRVQPFDALPGFAPLAASALLVAGQPEGASLWYDAASRNAATAAAAARLWPVMRVWGIGDPGQAMAWVESVGPRPVLVAAGVLGALGNALPDRVLTARLDVAGSAAIAPALWELLNGAARDKRVGGTLLAGLTMLDKTGFDKADPVVLARVVAALRAVGLERDAKMLATEIVFANGL